VLARMKAAQSATIFIVTVVVAGLVWMNWPSDAGPQAVASLAPPGWQQSGAANPFGQGAVSLQRPEPSTSNVSPQSPDLASSSLAGTQPDGDWDVNAQGQFKASRALRQRFDYYLSLIGEMPLASIEAAFRAAAAKDLKEPALGQVLGLWSAYVRLQQHDWKHAVNPQKPESSSAALTERQIVRRQTLGADVAYAFYAEEEAQLQQMLTQINSGQKGQGSHAESIPTAASHPQAAEREAAVQAQWQQWEQRLIVARSQIQAYKQAPELSAPQHQQAIERYLTTQFQGTELIRARALLEVNDAR
jgi:lipase chaperone LimK